MIAPSVPAGPVEVGEKFLKYAVLELIGRGGHAWVYRCRDDFMSREVAIKILHRPVGGVTPEMVKRGQAEAKLLHRLKHRNIVDVFDAGVTEHGLVYIVMELLRGRTLRSALQACGKLTVDEVLGLFEEIANGVELAHQERAIHRDLKPENVFLCEGNRPKVLDFGIAKFVDAAAWTTRRDIVHGTMLYMSPEQLYGFGVSCRSDVYSLGLMMYEALLGQHPYFLAKESPNVKQMAWIVATYAPPALDTLDITIPASLARLVARAMSKNSEERFKTMAELATALAACRERYRGEQLQAPAGRDLSSLEVRRAPTLSPVVITTALREGGTDTEHFAPLALSDTAPVHAVGGANTTRTRAFSVPAAAPHGDTEAIPEQEAALLAGGVDGQRIARAELDFDEADVARWGELVSAAFKRNVAEEAEATAPDRTSFVAVSQPARVRRRWTVWRASSAGAALGIVLGAALGLGYFSFRATTAVPERAVTLRVAAALQPAAPAPSPILMRDTAPAVQQQPETAPVVHEAPETAPVAVVVPSPAPRATTVARAKPVAKASLAARPAASVSAANAEERRTLLKMQQRLKWMEQDFGNERKPATPKGAAAASSKVRP